MDPLAFYDINFVILTRNERFSKKKKTITSTIFKQTGLKNVKKLHNYFQDKISETKKRFLSQLSGN